MARKIADTKYLIKPIDYRLVALLIVLAVVVVFAFNMMLSSSPEQPPETCNDSADCPRGYICYIGISKNSCFDQSCVNYCATQPTGCEGELNTVGKYPGCSCEFTCVSDMNCQAYCQKQPHIMCVGQWNISGVYPDCKCQWLCTEGGPM